MYEREGMRVRDNTARGSGEGVYWSRESMRKVCVCGVCVCGVCVYVCECVCVCTCVTVV